MTGTLSRRRLLGAAGASAAAFVLGFHAAPLRLLAGEEPATPAGPLPPPDAFLRIGADESVTVILAHTEMGQGIWTTLPMLVAEELECDWRTIRVEHAPAAAVYSHTVMGTQLTGGSTTTWSEFDRYRRAGAMVREVLVLAAARRWGVDPSLCEAVRGFVVRGGDRLSYGSLVEDAKSVPLPASVTLKPPGRWRTIGRRMARLNSAEKVTGRAQFGMDVQLPGLATALVLRPPVFGATLRTFSATKALAVPGVHDVVRVPSGVAVVAAHFWAAKLGRDALVADWDEGVGAALDTGRLREEYRRLASGGGVVAAKQGDAAAALGRAVQVVDAEYEVPFLAHAPMEPLNCTVQIGADGCDVWTGTQMQTADQAAAAKILGLEPGKVRIHTTFAGGGFGRRASSQNDFVSEAVHVAKAAGRSVKVIWTREDDLRGGFYRPMFLDRIRATLGPGGAPVAWRHAIAGQSIAAGTFVESFLVKDGVDGLSVEGAADSPYLDSIPDRLVELHTTKSPVPVLWWRSVGHSHTAFVVESFVDELAHAAGADPLAYRRRLLEKHPRHLGVLNAAARAARWDEPPAEGQGRGIAVHESFGSFVAAVAHVSVADGEIRVHRVVVAIDCGVCVNPLGVEAQLEGATAFALSAALYGELTINAGRVRESNFHDYRLLRIAGMPRVEAHVIPSEAKPGGAGEPGVPPIAPAVANAVFAATGRRLRRLPLSIAREKA